MLRTMRFAPPLFLLATLLQVACDIDDGTLPQSSAGLPECERAEVDRVVDGDTIVVRIDGRRDRVRYIGVDTPESVTPGQPVEPFGEEAAERNRDLLSDGRVCLERDISDRDRFGRLLRYAWLDDGRMVNEVLLSEGMANVVTFQPDVKYHDALLLPAQEAARAARLGIWSE